MNDEREAWHRVMPKHPPMKRTAKEWANAELDEALDKALMSIWRAPSIVKIEAQSSRIRDLFAREHERGWIEAMESRIHPAYIRKDEVRELMLEMAQHIDVKHMGTYYAQNKDGCRKMAERHADAILREHGYGGEP